MKAVIVGIKDGFASALSDDGCVKRIKNSNYAVGQVIQISEPRRKYTRKLAVFTASAAACLVFSFGTWVYASPYSYVSLDVNPSIEYTLNRFDRVLRVKAINDDGKDILKEINLKDLQNASIQEALGQTMELISKAGYFINDGQDGIMIATYGKNQSKAEEMAQTLQQTIKNKMTETDTNINIETSSVNSDLVEQAKDLGVTPGKLDLVEKLKESASDPESIDTQEWLSKSVTDIMKVTKENNQTNSAEASKQKASDSQANGQSSASEQQANLRQPNDFKDDMSTNDPTAGILSLPDVAGKNKTDKKQKNWKDWQTFDNTKKKDWWPSDKPTNKDWDPSDKSTSKNWDSSDKSSNKDWNPSDKSNNKDWDSSDKSTSKNLNPSNKKNSNRQKSSEETDWNKQSSPQITDKDKSNFSGKYNSKSQSSSNDIDQNSSNQAKSKNNNTLKKNGISSWSVTGNSKSFSKSK